MSSSIGASLNRNRRAPALTTELALDRPGVSTTMRSRRWSLVNATSTYEISLRGTPSRCGIIPDSSSGRLTREPSRRTTSTRSAVPYRNCVTMRVHSPTSVGATRRPMSAFTSVDLPDFNRPAIATRSGSDSRRRTSKTCPWVGPPSRWPTS